MSINKFVRSRGRWGVVLAALIASIGLFGCGGGDSGTAPGVPTVSLTANPTSVANGASSTLTWSSTNATSCTASGAWSGAKATSGNQSTGALTANGNYSLTCTGPGGSATASATVTVVGGGAVPRPAYNTGVGFFIGTNKKLYDANGVEFRMKGVNRNHYDGGSGAGITKSKANAVRWTLYWANGTTAAQFVAQLTNENHNNKIVAIPAIFDTDAAHGALTLTCDSTGTTSIRAAVQQWVDQAAVWKGIERWSIINIANEWGPSNSTVWRDEYISAVAALRAAGYLGTLMIDSGGCGQSFDNLIKYGQAVFDSDPQKNIIFSIHLYGNTDDKISLGNGISNITKANPAVVTYTGQDGASCCGLFEGRQIIITDVVGMTQVNSIEGASIYYKVKNLNVGAKTFELTNTSDINIDSTGYGTYISGGKVGPNAGDAVFQSRLQTLVNTGLPLVIGEFGPGRNIGPSPTMVWPGQIITGANALNVGWLAWAWDDNNLGGGTSNDSWFAMVYQNSIYNTTADLTIFGKDVVLDPTYGLQATAVSATIFP